MINVRRDRELSSILWKTKDWCAWILLMQNAFVSIQNIEDLNNTQPTGCLVSATPHLAHGFRLRNLKGSGLECPMRARLFNLYFYKSSNHTKRSESGSQLWQQKKKDSITNVGVLHWLALYGNFFYSYLFMALSCGFMDLYHKTLWPYVLWEKTIIADGNVHCPPRLFEQPLAFQGCYVFSVPVWWQTLSPWFKQTISNRRA